MHQDPANREPVHRNPAALAALLLALLVSPALAAPGVEAYFGATRSLEADFEQLVFDADGRPIQRSGGRVYMEKPNRFRWDYREPDPIVIVADGERIWHYDVALDQVTVQPLEHALGSGPMALLSGTAPIGEVFRIGAAYAEDGVEWTELHPVAAEGDFRVLRVGFREGELAVLELEDRFDQRTRMRLADLRRNVAIEPGLLRFEPPEGVDVVGAPFGGDG